MTIARTIVCLLAAGVLLGLCPRGEAGLGDLGKAVDIGKKIVDKDKEKKDEPSQAGKKDAGETDGGSAAAPTNRDDVGTIVFSRSPINVEKPENLTTDFKTGDMIYGLIRIDKSWRDLLGKGNKDAKEIQVPIDMLVDGRDVDFQYITIRNEKGIDAKHLVLDIAPDPAKMTAYKDEGYFYAEGVGNRKIGPDQYTYNLSTLKPGKHTIGFQVRSYGKIFCRGEFTIQGDDYKSYEKLRETILAEMLNVGGMPKEQMTNVQLQAEMMKLLQNAGWKNIRRLVIVDKDWWNDRIEGGDTAIIGRHIAAAVAAKADDGSFYWCNVTFEQKKQADGSFAPLELSNTGEKKPIKEENIDK